MAGNILVTCATGGLGQLTIEYLIAQNVPIHTIFAMVRDEQSGETMGWAKRGVSMRVADFTDPKSLTNALGAINTLMFISSSSSENRFDQHVNVIKAAKEVGTVQHIVYTSILKCSRDSKYLLTTDHWQTEEALRNSGIAFIICRNAFFMEMLVWILGDALISGKWHYPAGNAQINFVAKADVAEGLAKILVNVASYGNRTFEIASGRSYTFAMIAPIVSKAIGTEIAYQSITIDSFKYNMKGYGLSEYDVKHYVSVAEAIAAGQLDVADKTLERIIGRRTRSMEEHLPVILVQKANSAQLPS